MTKTTLFTDQYHASAHSARLVCLTETKDALPITTEARNKIDAGINQTQDIKGYEACSIELKGKALSVTRQKELGNQTEFKTAVTELQKLLSTPRLCDEQSLFAEMQQDLNAKGEFYTFIKNNKECQTQGFKTALDLADNPDKLNSNADGAYGNSTRLAVAFLQWKYNQVKTSNRRAVAVDGAFGEDAKYALNYLAEIKKTCDALPTVVPPLPVEPPPPPPPKPCAECEPGIEEDFGAITKALEAVQLERERLSIAVDPKLKVEFKNDRPVAFLNFKSEDDRKAFETELQAAIAKLPGNQDAPNSLANFGEKKDIPKPNAATIKETIVKLANKYSKDNRRNYYENVLDLRLTKEGQKQLATKLDELTKQFADADAKKDVQAIKDLYNKNIAIIQLIPRDRLPSESPLSGAIKGFFEGIGKLAILDFKGLEQMNHWLGRDMLRSRNQSYIDVDGKIGTFGDMELEEAKVNSDNTNLDNSHYEFAERKLSDEQIKAALLKTGCKPEELDALIAEYNRAKPNIFVSKNGEYIGLTETNPKFADAGLVKLRLELGNNPVDFVFDRYTDALPNEAEFAEFQQNGQLPKKIGTLDLTHELYEAIIKGNPTPEQIQALQDCGPISIKFPVDRSKMIWGAIVFVAALYGLRSQGKGGEGPCMTCSSPIDSGQGVDKLPGII